MATSTDQFTMATSAAFIQRVEIALVTAAIAVMAEASATVDHSFRIAYAGRVLRDPSGEAAKFAFGIATNSTIAATAPTGSGSTDSDIQFAVNSMFGAYARS